MYRNCTTEKSAQRQQALTVCLLDVLQTRSIHEISVSELCRLSGVSRKQFYQLFDSKADVAIALIDRIILEYESFVPDSSVASGDLRRSLAYWKAQKPLLDVLTRDQMSALLIERCLYHATHEDPSLMETFGITDTDCHREMLLFYLSGILSVIMHWHGTGYARSIDEMADLLTVLMQKAPVKPW